MADIIDLFSKSKTVGKGLGASDQPKFRPQGQSRGLSGRDNRPTSKRPAGGWRRWMAPLAKRNPFARRPTRITSGLSHETREVLADPAMRILALYEQGCVALAYSRLFFFVGAVMAFCGIGMAYFGYEMAQLRQPVVIMEQEASKP